MPVENHELWNALPREGHRDVAQHERLRAGIHVHAEWNVELAGIHAEWYQRQHDDLRATFPRASGGAGRDFLRLDVVGGIGEMEIVRLRRPPRQDGDLVPRIAHGLPGQLVENVRASGHAGA